MLLSSTSNQNQNQEKEMKSFQKSIDILEKKVINKSSLGTMEKVDVKSTSSMVTITLDPFEIDIKTGNQDLTNEKMIKAYPNVVRFEEGPGLVFIRKILEIRKIIRDDNYSAVAGLKLLRYHTGGNANSIVEYSETFVDALARLFQFYFTQKAREEYLLDFSKMEQSTQQTFAQFADQVIVRGSVLKLLKRKELVMKYFIFGKNHALFNTWKHMVNFEESEKLEDQIHLLAAMDEKVADVKRSVLSTPQGKESKE